MSLEDELAREVRGGTARRVRARGQRRVRSQMKYGEKSLFSAGRVNRDTLFFSLLLVRVCVYISVVRTGVRDNEVHVAFNGENASRDLGCLSGENRGAWFRAMRGQLLGVKTRCSFPLCFQRS